MTVKSNWKESGASLLQIMAFMGVLTFAGFVITRSMTNQKLASRAAVTRDAIEQLHEVVYASLQNQINCRSTFSTYNFDTAIIGTPTSFPSILDVSGTAIFSTLPDGSAYDANRMYMNNNVRIPLMQVTTLSDSDARVEVTYERHNSSANVRSKDGYGGKFIKKTIAIKIQRLATNDGSKGAYVTCHAHDTDATTGNQDAMKDFCENFGDGGSLFTWDTVNNVCKLEDHLCYGQLFIGVDSTGRARCADLQDWLDINNIIDPSGSACAPGQANDIKFIQVGNKVKVHCGTLACVSNCPALEAATACGVPAGNDVCGSPCGLGTNGCSANLAWAPLTHNFGNVTVGSDSANQTFTLTNSGSIATTGCTAPTITDTTNFTLTPSGNCVGTNNLGPGTNCTVTVRGNPASTGSKTTTLSRTCTTGGTATTTTNQIIVNGTSASCPALTLVSVTNTSGNIYELAWTGVDVSATAVSKSYSVSPSGPWSSSTGSQVSPGTVNVGSAGTWYFKVTQWCGGVTESPNSNVLSNSAILVFSPLTHAFGTVSVGSTSAWVNFTLTNTSTTINANPCAPILMKEDYDHFEINPIGACAGTSGLPAELSCTVQVRAKPTSPGSKVFSIERACTGAGVGSTTTSGITLTATGLSDGTACANDINVPGVDPCSYCDNAPVPSPAGYCCPANFSFGYRCGMTEQMQTCYDISGGLPMVPQWQNPTWDCEN